MTYTLKNNNSKGFDITKPNIQKYYVTCIVIIKYLNFIIPI